MKSKESSINEQTIKQLVDNFYAKVKMDPDLNPIFSNAIGENYNEWHSHLEKMYDFWSSIMLGSNRYRGNPLKKHRELPVFDSHLFERWLKLFAETAEDLYSLEIASEYIKKSQMIASSLKRNLYSQDI